MEILPYLLVALTAAVVGSYLGAFTYRFPRGINISSGRSFCPNCKKTIAWYDNIPIFSYLVLSGKCRSCHQKISVRYPLIEGLTILTVFLVYYFSNHCMVGTDLNKICYWESILGSSSMLLIFFTTLIFISVLVVDFENKIIPDEFSFALLIAVFVFVILGNPDSFWSIVFSGFLASTFLLLINVATKGKGMGLGDAKLAIPAGVLLGLKVTIVWFYLSFIIGAFVGVILILLKRAKFGREIAFGPFLVLSFFIALMFGEYLQHLLLLK